jgi:alpha-L-rhamnosidase
MKHYFLQMLLLAAFPLCHLQAQTPQRKADSLATIFLHPPEAAKPGVLWMWMGSNLSKKGISKDLEALKEQGFNRTTMFSLADITTPWAGEINNSPTPELVSWTEPWWELVRFAAQESRRLGMDFGMFNGPSYESSGGTWITPELSMQEVCWSADTVMSNTSANIVLKKPTVDPRANQYYPVYNPLTGLVENPVIEARKKYYKDIAVLAMPADGIVPVDKVIDLSGRMSADGKLTWQPPAGNWVIYRFGHTTRGTLIQPAQWKATGFECDKMSREAVSFHMDHVIGEIKKHLGDLIGTGFTHVHFDSYEAGNPTWTPNMKAAFASRRGYDCMPYLASFAGRIINSREDSVRFSKDFDATIKDLHRDIYFATIAAKLKEAGLVFLCEPYGGPWRQDDIMPMVGNVMTEFWTHGGKFSPYELEPTVAALRKSGQNIVEAEAFTGDPADSKWNETPEWLKPIGDAAFCAGVNRFVLHRFVQQPWEDKYKPGATMGRWGTHFDRTQTWWKPGKALVDYWQRCQALLQWGSIAPAAPNDFVASTTDSIIIKGIHRQKGTDDIYFVANTARVKGRAVCSFLISGRQAELWDPVTRSMRTMKQVKDNGQTTTFTIPFEKAQSFFIVFRQSKPKTIPTGTDFPLAKTLMELKGPWTVRFDSIWGGPAQAVVFPSLADWTLNGNSGIKYYSGTAVYTKHFDMAAGAAKGRQLYLDLGAVKHIASVSLNGRNLGVVWTAPWRISIPRGLLRSANNQLSVAVSNVWANRLIGDEQEPADCEWLPGHIDNGKFLKAFPEWFLKKQARPSMGRYCFTTWNYFTKDSPLVPSGLLGPVQFVVE